MDLTQYHVNRLYGVPDGDPVALPIIGHERIRDGVWADLVNFLGSQYVLEWLYHRAVQFGDASDMRLGAFKPSRVAEGCPYPVTSRLFFVSSVNLDGIRPPETLKVVHRDTALGPGSEYHGLRFDGGHYHACFPAVGGRPAFELDSYRLGLMPYGSSYFCQVFAMLILANPHAWVRYATDVSCSRHNHYKKKPWAWTDRWDTASTREVAFNLFFLMKGVEYADDLNMQYVFANRRQAPVVKGDLTAVNDLLWYVAHSEGYARSLMSSGYVDLPKTRLVTLVKKNGGVVGIRSAL